MKETKANQFIRKNKSLFIFGLIIVGLVGFAFASSYISNEEGSLNLNGQNQYRLYNYSEITGVGNMSIGNGINYLDIYSDGATNVFDTLGYNAYFTDNITIEDNSGEGNAFACFDTNGKLFRSATACV